MLSQILNLFVYFVLWIRYINNLNFCNVDLFKFKQRSWLNQSVRIPKITFSIKNNSSVISSKNSSNCSKCEEGLYSIKGNTVCSKCLENEYYDFESDSCLNITNNTFTSNISAISHINGTISKKTNDKSLKSKEVSEIKDSRNKNNLKEQNRSNYLVLNLLYIFILIILF